jgi:hypothetical protein
MSIIPNIAAGVIKPSAATAGVDPGAMTGTAVIVATIPDDLSIPEFLKREFPAVARPVAAEKDQRQ